MLAADKGQFEVGSLPTKGRYYTKQTHPQTHTRTRAYGSFESVMWRHKGKKFLCEFER